MALIDRFTLASSPTFIRRVQMALVNTAIGLTASPTPAIVVMAKLILREPKQWATHFALGCAADGTLTEASTDNQIEARLAAIFSAYVGVF